MACLAEGRAIAINSAAASEGFRPPFPGDGGLPRRRGARPDGAVYFGDADLKA